MSVRIAGVASTLFSERPDFSIRELFTAAVLEGASLSVRNLGNRSTAKTVTIAVEQRDDG
jgi:hypothetical protein